MPSDGKDGRPSSLPLHDCWGSEDDYVQSLLTFVSTSEIFRNLCGGVHILDFLTREPDLYATVLPQDWRDWVDDVDVHDFLELLLRSDLDQAWSGNEFAVRPPRSLLEYIQTVRKHCLLRSVNPNNSDVPHMPRHVSVGMKPKKIHEVSSFATYVDNLASRVSKKVEQPVSLIDFGSGQNYLGRTLASPPYHRNVIAIERKHHNVEGARGMDVYAKLAKKEKIMRNKKEYKRRLNAAMENGLPTPPPEDIDMPVQDPAHTSMTTTIDSEDTPASKSRGSMTYIEHNIQTGDLNHILPKPSTPTSYMTISLHSCGNLSHHALRSLPLNPTISAIAVIGCCYNLLTERLGPATLKHPILRSNHPRLLSTSTSFDPHGFPLSQRLETFTPPPHPPSPSSTSSTTTQTSPGIRLNITARMMAVQAPQNWGFSDSETFFTRHFYRALLQRIFLDHGVVRCISPENLGWEGNSLSGTDEVGTPLIIGSLRKSAFGSFGGYVGAAVEKLLGAGGSTGSAGAETGAETEIKTETETGISGDKGGHEAEDKVEHEDITRQKLIATAPLLTSEVITHYESQYAHARHHLAVIWSLMAFSAGVVESVIAVDRWLFLKEQECVSEAWVEAVFEYGLSPRNLCVVGIRKVDGKEG